MSCCSIQGFRKFSGFHQAVVQLDLIVGHRVVAREFVDKGACLEVDEFGDVRWSEVSALKFAFDN